MTAVPQTHIEALIDAYELLLFDAYGVLVHAAGAMPGARQLIELLNALRKPYFVITNDASKLPETAATRYQRFGVAVPVERILTSGQLIARYFAEQQLAGARCAVLGTPDSEAYVSQAGGELVGPASDFEVLVIGDETGYPFVEAVDDALTSMFHRLDRGDPIHLVLPNPDLIYPRGTRSFGIASGSIALIFEAALQRRFGARAPRFVRLGKPQPDLYREAIARSGIARAVMIGDQLETDIRGALAAGIDATLVATGVSVTLDSIAQDMRPTYWMASVAPAGAGDEPEGDAAPINLNGVAK